MADVRTYDLHIVIRPADDVPGQWVAHCLEFDVVTQGDNLAHAWSMIQEALEIVVVGEIRNGLDPARRAAPQEFWDELWTKLMPRTVNLPLEAVLKRGD